MSADYSVDSIDQTLKSIKETLQHLSNNDDARLKIDKEMLELMKPAPEDESTVYNVSETHVHITAPTPPEQGDIGSKHSDPYYFNGEHTGKTADPAKKTRKIRVRIGPDYHRDPVGVPVGKSASVPDREYSGSPQIPAVRKEHLVGEGAVDKRYREESERRASERAQAEKKARKVKPKLPTTPGSVVQADSLLMLTRFGNWVSDGVFVVDIDILEEEDFVILFDAGKPQS